MPEHPNPKLRTPAPPSSAHADALPYAELSVATNFSFLRGASHADELVNRAAELGYRAIAVTDRNTLAGVVRMHVAAKEAGLKLLVGCRLDLLDHPSLLVWPSDRAAYGRLSRLLTLGKRRAEKAACHLEIADVLAHADGLLAAIIPPEVIPDNFCQTARDLKSALGDRLSLAACALFESDNRTRLHHLAHISQTTGVPMLATNDVHYHDPQRRMLQDVLTCIRHGCTIQQAGYRLFQNGERYLKSPQQMHALFADYPPAIVRGLEISRRCNFSLDSLRYEYPHELSPPGQTPRQYLASLAWAGAAQRYPAGVPAKVQSLIAHELKLIEELKIEAYFLTVYDLVQFARARGILCQGRGSAANSAVCYCIGVTSVDPARIDVLFERFVSAARNEPPDIDIDFEHERREEVIQYVYEKYGRDRAGMTAEIISYRGRSAVRDVGKVMGLDAETVDLMAKRLDWWDRGTLSPQRIAEIGLDPNDRTIRLVLEITAQLLGFPRHLGQHVGGMVMTSGLLSEMVPIANAAMADRTVIEWDKQDIDDLKILKVDLLALGMLTCISKCLKLINAESEISNLKSQIADLRLELHTIPPEAPAVYAMIGDADTVGVFQIESRAQMAMLPRLRPRTFYDLVIEIAIVRPGPIQGDMVHPYLRRRNGEEAISYPSDAMRQVLEKTLGVPLFQEQAMRVAMVGAGFSAEEADKLRRAMAAWRRDGGLEVFQRKIIDGMTANGYSVAYAQQCYNMLRGFGEYGFPESHSASFALLVYVSAWIKRHYPAEFCCGLLNSQPMGFYAPAQIVRDAQYHGVMVLPVDINHSDWDCTLEFSPSPGTPGEGWGEGTVPPLPDVKPRCDWNVSRRHVRLGFCMLRGFRKLHAEQIVQTRQKGRFASVEQLATAADLPASAMQKLAQADALQSLALSRRQGLWQALQISDETIPLFAAPPDTAEEIPPALPDMPIAEQVTVDYQTSGLSLKRHPLALLRGQLRQMRIITAAELACRKNGDWVRVAGLVLVRQRPGTAAGIVFQTLEDETGVANLIVMPEIYDRFRPIARYAALLQADGIVQRQGKVIHLRAQRMADLTRLLQAVPVASRDFH